MARALLSIHARMRFLAVYLSLTLPVLAAERLTLDDAVRSGLEASPQLRDARRALAVAESELAGARSWMPSNPKLEGELLTDMLTGREGEYAWSATVSQELEVALQGGLRKSAARAQVEAQAHGWEAARRDVALRIATAWMDAWQASRQRALAEEAREVGAGLAKASQARFEAGDLPELERNVVELELARAQAAAAEAEASWQSALVALSQMLGQDVALNTQLPDPELAEAGLAVARAEVAAAAKSRESSELSVRLRRRERIPNLTLGVGVERSRELLHGPAGEHLESEDWMVQASLSLPLPVFDLNEAELGRARAELDAAKSEQAAVNLRSRLESRAAEATLASRRRAAEAFEAVLPRVRRNLELLQRGFEAGQVDLTALLFARDRTLAAQREAVEARAAHARAAFELRHARGLFPVEGLR